MRKYHAPNSLLPFYLAEQNQTNNANNRYNLCFSYHLTSESQVNVLIEMLQKLIKSQAYLRQTFTLEADTVVARIHSDLPANIHFFSSTIADLDKLEKTLTNEPHDFGKYSAIRLNLIKINEDESYLAFFNIHHILMDGFSLKQFINDLNQLIAGQPIVCENAETYLSRVKNELSLQEGIEHPDLESYLQEVADIANHIEYQHSNVKSELLYFTQVLPQDLKQKLTNASKNTNLSIFNLLLLAWSTFIAKLSNQNNVLVNYPVNIRIDKSIPGCFINLIVLPLRLRPQETYLSLIKGLKAKLPFYKLLSQIELRNRVHFAPISSFASSNFAKPGNIFMDDKSFPSKAYPQIANSNLSIKYKEEEDSLIFSLDIFSDLFPACVTSTLLPRFFNYCNKLLGNPELPCLTFDLTFEREKKLILSEFNQTLQSFPQGKTLPDLFEEQVEKTPERTALVFEGVKLTYNELNQKANRLAHYLSDHYHVKPDDLIALLLERNEYILIAILAILKTGGAYVPLDLSYPSERIEYILEDTEVKMVLTNEIHRDKFLPLLDYSDYEYQTAPNRVDIIAIDSQKIQDELNEFEITNVITADTSANLAYVIYTSGTTGKPKGVMIEHKNVINTLCALDKVYQKKEDADEPLKITAFTSYAFDVSVSEFFVPLLRGDELHLLSSTLRRDILATSKYLYDNKINYVYLPPVLLANLPRIKYPDLLAIIYAGEPCDKETAHYWSNKIKLFNYYGPTEASIYATGKQIEVDEVNLIGKPIANTTAYVLNAEKQLLPIGIAGELYLGGQGLAKGYLNNRELTAERFISNPFQTEEEKIQGINSRLYKTGDLVRWTPEGNLEYLGRNDFQVKIRGYRIELGEIENALINYPDIDQVVVLVRNLATQEEATSHKILVAYYVAKEKINQQNLEAHLALHLPDYMHPMALMHLTEFPVTANGKLDRNALPMPELMVADNYIPPTNNKEKNVCDSFAKVLGLSKVGIEDDFFKIGGNSIMAISLVAKLQVNFNITVMDIFNLKTPKKIAKNIPFIKDNLKHHLEKIRADYQSKTLLIDDETHFQEKLDYYFESIHQFELPSLKNPISHVLLTGATGFLGANLLNSLLTTTDYSLFLLVRATSDEEAFERVSKKYEYYFDSSLHHFHNKRLFVYAGDIEKKDLGISKEIYQTLVTQVDSIIHSAALTKHYGIYDTFYLANVQATIHLLELSKLTELKYFHYISTTSVLNEGYVPNCGHYVFTEEDEGDNLEDRSNIYVKTKYEGEKIVIKYRKHGVISNIYRVGNLAFMFSNQKAQENSSENGFFTRLCCLIDLKMISPEIGIEEISPADLTAQAIVKLFDHAGLDNKTFHVFNPTTCDLSAILSEEGSFNVEQVPIEQFITIIINLLDNPDHHQSIELFLLHRRWLNEQHDYSTSFRILQDKTQAILKKLGFEWPRLNKDIVSNYLKKEIQRAKESKDS
ncbi:peptide synthetase, non-ribosomal [Legionella nautarum]|uniref:Peptide synthetase, non-ribosomal n=1 Tax=Legionella nautarum TaxID=45070 RepID=A0A0W0WL46_9GAMM|nr:non-ribosomal peptide synthetase [Legionella nautarum]KTD33049.1 peptide synthetase, non-ribosomal [Legionella nautarum]